MSTLPSTWTETCDGARTELHVIDGGDVGTIDIKTISTSPTGVQFTAQLAISLSPEALRQIANQVLRVAADVEYHRVAESGLPGLPGLPGPADLR